jgi:coenzyme F420-0:L-glutamate ligase/coenzyme F420-1:gamma-L-glutamate ligase
MRAVSLTAVPGLPDIQPGDDLATIFAGALIAADLALQEGDILCVAQKVVSKAEGCLVAYDSVTPSPQALQLADELGKDPRKLQVILDESRSIVRSFRNPGAQEGTIICEHRLGFISANAAVDESNIGSSAAALTLPRDPDASCRSLASRLSAAFGARVGLVMTDTFGRPWRLGQVNVAIGLAGPPATLREQGNCDAWGRRLQVTEPALADEIAAASGLVVRKAGRTPLVLLRGLDWQAQPHARALDLIRKPQEDRFR